MSAGQNSWRSSELKQQSKSFAKNICNCNCSGFWLLAIITNFNFINLVFSGQENKHFIYPIIHTFTGFHLVFSPIPSKKKKRGKRKRRSNALVLFTDVPRQAIRGSYRGSHIDYGELSRSEKGKMRRPALPSKR